MENTKLLRMVTILYGFLVDGIVGIFLVSLYLNGDLTLVEGPHRFEAMLSDIIALLMMFWGICFVLLGIWRKQEIGVLCLVLAIVNMVFIAWGHMSDGNPMSFIVWGIAFHFFLFVLPTALVTKALTAETRLLAS
ncbi:MAG: hypothetical protein D6802_10900 [Ardenticatenia bacterium]|nr:MAG: hypothetical protein D6802_10900 [Ardenticatenia bacterium]